MKQYENVIYMDIISREYVPQSDNNIYIEVTYYSCMHLVAIVSLICSLNYDPRFISAGRFDTLE